MSLQRLLIQKCDVYTRTTTQDAYGGIVDVYALSVSGVKCRSVHTNNKFDAFAGRINASAVHLLYIDNAVTLNTTNRLVLDDGVTYQVIHADQKHDGRGPNHAEYLTQAVESPQTGA